MNKHIRDKIDAFLKHRRRSAGGWAPVTMEDITQLEGIVQALIDAKTSPDPDGDRPIEFMIINRRTHYSMRYSAMPYDHEPSNPEGLPPPPTRDEVLDVAMMNLSIASNDVTNLYSVIRHYDREAMLNAKHDPKEPIDGQESD